MSKTLRDTLKKIHFNAYNAACEYRSYERITKKYPKHNPNLNLASGFMSLIAEINTLTSDILSGRV